MCFQEGYGGLEFSGLVSGVVFWVAGEAVGAPLFWAGPNDSAPSVVLCTLVCELMSGFTFDCLLADSSCRSVLVRGDIGYG